MILFKHNFRENVKDVVTEVKDEEEKDWRPLEFRTARIKYKFNIYSKKEGSISRYIIATKEPNFLWTELKNLPQGVTFEEAKTKEHIYCRLLKGSIPERGAIMKLPRPKTGV